MAATTRGLSGARPSSRPEVGRRRDHRVGPGLAQQRGVLLLTDARGDLRTGVESAGGERDEHGGVVPVSSHHDRSRPLHTCTPQDVAATGVLDDPGGTCGVGLLDGTRILVDHHDPLQRRARLPQGADGVAPLGAVTADDDVLPHARGEPSGAELLPRAGGQSLERRPDQHDEEGDAQRRDDQGVDTRAPSLTGTRSPYP
jgi:hypothetical protein